MKFTLHRKPDSKAQKIPFPAMQIAGLADAEALVLRAEEGCILLAPLSAARPTICVRD